MYSWGKRGDKRTFFMKCLNHSVEQYRLPVQQSLTNNLYTWDLVIKIEGSEKPTFTNSVLFKPFILIRTLSKFFHSLYWHNLMKYLSQIYIQSAWLFARCHFNFRCPLLCMRQRYCVSQVSSTRVTVGRLLQAGQDGTLACISPHTTHAAQKS